MPARILHAVPDPDHYGDPTGPTGADQPCDLTAEKAVLGAALTTTTGFDHGQLAAARTLIGPEDFYRPAHALIWQAIGALADAGEPIDMVTVAARLGHDLVRVGGAPYLHDCVRAAGAGSAAGPHYAQIVRDVGWLRRVDTLGTRLRSIARTAYEPELRAAVAAQLRELGAADARGWAEPVPLASVRRVPPFPLGTLPGWVRAKVEVVSQEMQTPPDLAATVALACSPLHGRRGGAGGGTPEARLVQEPVNLYTVCAMPPGLAQVPGVHLHDRPDQRRYQAAAARADQDADHRARHRPARRRRLRRAARRAPGQGGSGRARGTALRSLRRTAGRRGDHGSGRTGAVRRRHHPRGGRSKLADQGGRFALLSAESEIFAVIAGRYSGTPNLNVFLKGHAGDELRVDRRGRPREVVARPALTLGVCTQPEALAELAAIPGAAGRGLLGRFLFSIPDSNIGSRDSNPDVGDPAAHETYARNLTALVTALRPVPSRLTGTDDAPGALTLTLTPQAAELVNTIAAAFEKAMADGGPLAQLRDWGGKAVGTMMRIAGLLHLAEHVEDGWYQPISAETVTAAHALIEYYRDHTLAAFDRMATDPTTDRARLVLKWTETSGATRFTAREAFRGLTRNRFPNMTDLEPALNLLERHGYLRRMPAPPSGPRGGRAPSVEYETHPCLADGP